MTLVRVPVVKMWLNVYCCYEYTFVLVTQADAVSSRKAEQESKKNKNKKTIEGCLPTTKEREIQRGTNN